MGGTTEARPDGSLDAEGAAPAAVRATAHGPMSGTDPVEPTRVVRGELGEPNLPHLVQLPDRGVGSDAVGRTASMLEELFVDVQPFGWRLVDRPGVDHRRAASALATDIAVTADLIGAEEQPGGELKIQLRGPFSLAANLHLHHGERALADAGARRDLADSLATGAARHLADVLRTSGRSRVTVAIEEPELADVLGGTIPTASGYRTLRSIPRHETTRAWSALAEALRGAGAAAVVLAPGTAPVAEQAGDDAGASGRRRPAAVPGSVRDVFDDAVAAGLDGLCVPLGALDTAGWERCAALVEQDRQLWLGVFDPAKAPPTVVKAVERLLRPWRQLGLPVSALSALTLLPTTGLEAVSPANGRTVLARLGQTADALNQVRLED